MTLPHHNVLQKWSAAIRSCGLLNKYWVMSTNRWLRFKFFHGMLLAKTEYYYRIISFLYGFIQAVTLSAVEDAFT